MVVKCGWASVGETGRGRGNKAGDQTGREVKLGAWYDFGQTVMLRFKKRTIAEAYAKAIRQMCNNQNIGYDMDDRDTLWNALNKVGWDVSKVVKPVECDCSMLVACGVNVAVGKALKRHPRESFFLASKFPGYDVNNFGKHKEIFEEQLKKCQVDYVEFY